MTIHVQTKSDLVQIPDRLEAAVMGVAIAVFVVAIIINLVVSFQSTL